MTAGEFERGIRSYACKEKEKGGRVGRSGTVAQCAVGAGLADGPRPIERADSGRQVALRNECDGPRDRRHMAMESAPAPPLCWCCVDEGQNLRGVVGQVQRRHRAQLEARGEVVLKGSGRAQRGGNRAGTVRERDQGE